MIFFQKSYFFFMRILLENYGLWPSEPKLSKKIFVFAHDASTLSLLFALIAGLAEQHRKVPHVIYENAMIILCLLLAIANIFIMQSNREKIKKAYKDFLDDYHRISCLKEKKIFASYIEKGELRVNLILLFCGPALIVAGGLTFYPAFMDTSENALSEHFPYYFSKMIIDERFHYPLVDLHVIAGFLFFAFCFFAIGAVFIMYATHVSGMFAIARYRLNNVTNISYKKTKWSNSKLHQLMRNGKIICKMNIVIQHHSETVQKVHLIDNAFMLNVLLMQISALGGFSFLAYDICRNDSNIVHVIRGALVISTFLLYNYFVNWSAQEIIETCQQFFITSYTIDWYTMPVQARKMLVILRHETSNLKSLTAGRVFILSLNNFLWILKTSWSIAAVLLSTQGRARYKFFL